MQKVLSFFFFIKEKHVIKIKNYGMLLQRVRIIFET